MEIRCSRQCSQLRLLPFATFIPKFPPRFLPISIIAFWYASTPPLPPNGGKVFFISFSLCAKGSITIFAGWSAWVSCCTLIKVRKSNKVLRGLYFPIVAIRTRPRCCDFDLTILLSSCCLLYCTRLALHAFKCSVRLVAVATLLVAYC